MATVPTLTVCCVCKHVAPTGPTHSQWMPVSTFLEQQHLRPVDVRFTHTYCPVCYERQAEAWAIAPKAGSEKTPRAA
jgi:hypothetical protein